MARHARIVLPEVPLHIVQRGNNRQQIFWDDVDRRVYLRLLETSASMAGCDVHAFVLMTNHVHLLATPREAAAPARMMKSLGQNYAQYANRKRRRTGSLWEGRFWSGMVGDGGYVMRCQRYIELNPKRAGMVRSPAEYRWSSFRSNAGYEPALPVLRMLPTFCQFSSNEGVRAMRYREFCEEDPSALELAAIRDALNGGFAWGSEAFEQRVTAELGEGAIRRRARQQERSQPLRFEECNWWSVP
jgi:putative transposase